jgi:hypothetical protein
LKDKFLINFVEYEDNYDQVVKKMKKIHPRCLGKSKRQRREIATNIVNNGIRKIVFSKNLRTFKHLFSEYAFVATRSPVLKDGVLLSVVHLGEE